MAAPASDDTPGAVDRSVSVADCALSAGGILRTSGLGSCLGVALHDPAAGIGGLVHPMLPVREDESRQPSRYVDAGIEQLLERLVDAGANQERVVARVSGGAAVVEFGWHGEEESIGARNVAAAKQVLAAADVELVGLEVGGEHGRSMRFDTATGELVVERTDGVRTVL